MFGFAALNPSYVLAKQGQQQCLFPATPHLPWAKN
jgi:hypothetical protein